MKRIVVLAALLLVLPLAGCGPKEMNPLAPAPSGDGTAVNGRSDANRAQYYPGIVGEPNRGTDPDLGPTG